MTTRGSVAAATILLVNDNLADVGLVRAILNESNGHFNLESVGKLSAALERLGQGGIDVVLLDLRLPDSSGVETVLRTRAGAPLVPIIVLAALTDMKTAVEALRNGAQEYILKSFLNRDVLIRAIGRRLLAH